MSQLRKFARKFHGNTTGAMSVEKVFIIALIALPILLGLLAFRKTLVEWFTTQKDQIQP